MKKLIWPSYKKALKLVHSFKLKSYKHYCQYIKNHKIHLPYHPERTYKKEWATYGKWIGTNFISTHKRKYLTFDEARKVILKDAKKYELKRNNWAKYYKKNKLSNIPSNPSTTYKNKGWISWGHWFGTYTTVGAQRKYSVNHDFFKTWSNDMAYILGFWFADGCITHNARFRITQHEKDKYLLEKISKIMKSNYPLEKTHDYYYDLSIHSYEIYNDIIKLGGKKRKSMDVKFPKIPKKFISDFIRGFFDGDGCVYKRKSGKYTRFGSTIVCGSKEFIIGLYKCLNKNLKNFKGILQTIPERWEFIKGKKCKFRKHYRLNMEANDTRKLRDFMYNNPNELRLIRKYEKFMSGGNIKIEYAKRKGVKYGIDRI